MAYFRFRCARGIGKFEEYNLPFWSGTKKKVEKGVIVDTTSLFVGGGPQTCMRQAGYKPDITNNKTNLVTGNRSYGYKVYTKDSGIVKPGQ